jgi:hypothetical protein
LGHAEIGFVFSALSPIDARSRHSRGSGNPAFQRASAIDFAANTDSWLWIGFVFSTLVYSQKA